MTYAEAKQIVVTYQMPLTPEQIKLYKEALAILMNKPLRRPNG